MPGLAVMTLLLLLLTLRGISHALFTRNPCEVMR